MPMFINHSRVDYQGKLDRNLTVLYSSPMTCQQWLLTARAASVWKYNCKIVIILLQVKQTNDRLVPGGRIDVHGSHSEVYT